MKKYPMDVTLDEAYAILTARASEKRKKKGYRPVLDPACKPKHFTEKQIRDAVTLTILQKGK